VDHRTEKPSTHRSFYILASLLWCAAALAIKPFYPYLDFAVFYSTAMDFILNGRPLDIYSFIAHPPGSELALPLTNPPLYVFILVPVYALGHLIGISDFHASTGISLGQAWMLLATLPFDLLLCREAVRLVERIRGPLEEPRRWILFLCLLLSPLLWVSSIRYGHNEAMMVALVLLAIGFGEKDRPLLAGIFWGLALGLKTTAAVPLLVWLGWGMGRGRARKTVASAVTAGGVFLTPLLPYLLLRGEQVWYALVGFEGLRPVGGYVLWKLVPLPDVVLDLSGPAILAGSAAVGLVLSRRSGESFLRAGGAYALVLGQVLLLLFGKALFAWYGLALGVFCYLAFFPRDGRTRLFPLGAMVCTVLLWFLQAGPWVGEAVSPMIRLRSAAWVVFLISLGAFAVRGLIRNAAER